MEYDKKQLIICDNRIVVPKMMSGEYPGSLLVTFH